MSDIEQNIPDDFWRQAFDEAAETPPPRVWDAIERRLDESDGAKVLPLWAGGVASSALFGWGMRAAAAIALLLIGWWAVRSVDETPVVPKQQPAQVAAKPQKPQQEPSATVPLKSADVHAPTEPSVAAAAPKRVEKKMPSRMKLENQPLSVAPDLALRQRAILTPDVYFPSIVRQREGIETVPDLAVSDETPSLHSDRTESAATLQIDLLKSRTFATTESMPIHRIVWFRPAEAEQEPTEVKQQSEKREFWASVSLMPGTFNPSVMVQAPVFAANTSFVNSQASVSQPSVQSRANFSVAYQAGAGLQLTERWSVESGVGYLAGRSTVESPTQGYYTQSALLGANTANRNLYADALQNSSGKVVLADAVNSLGSFYQNRIQANYSQYNRQTLSNDFQFVQVPVQVGYQLRPRKRLSMALLGGFLTNIFVRNTVDNELVIRSGDGVYRPLSWAASVGARFRYRPSRRWSASLAGLYQPTLGAATRPESQVQSRPTTTGMSFGIDYHF